MSDISHSTRVKRATWIIVVKDIEGVSVVVVVGLVSKAIVVAVELQITLTETKHTSLIRHFVRVP